MTLLRKKGVDKFQELLNRDYWVPRPAKERLPGLTEFSIIEMRVNQDLGSLGHLVPDNKKGRRKYKVGPI